MGNMIPVHFDWTAIYKGEDGRTNGMLHVEAWDEHGCALVVDQDNGNLVRAIDLPGFSGLGFSSSNDQKPVKGQRLPWR